MKIGIITFHSAHNYGAVLQAFALKEYLSKKGHDVHVINYKIKEIENVYKLIKFKKSKNKIVNVCKKGVKTLKLHLFERKRLYRRRKFEEFINTQLNVTEPCKTLADLQNANFDFDLLIAGSDQIWNRKHTKGLKPAYFLEFGKPEATRISYAASIGEDFILKEDELVFQRYLKNLDFISVREHKAKELIEHLTPKKIEEVVDPSQLLEAQDYEKIRENPKFKKDYIMVHKMGNPEEIIKLAEKVSEELNLPIVHNMDKGTFKNELGTTKYMSPGEWLGCIANAKFVITSSFHATSFSLIYGKPFITMPFVGRASRMINLLKNLDLFDHYVENVEQLKSLDTYNVNYDIVHPLMREKRKKSEEFLQKAIEYKKTKIDDNYFKAGDKFNCYGCTACANICPKGAITMVEDEEGFTYPKIDEEKCIKCGLCENTCIYKNEKIVDKNKLRKVYAIYSNNNDVRKNSTSGGAFTGLYTNVINNGGYVVGVKYDDEMNAIYDIANTLEECEKFRGSKYVRANNDRIYPKIKEKLETGKPVLVTGTPCFVAGLKAYLNKDYKNLTTMDMICHGTPSQKILKKYIEELEEQYNSKIKDLKFRDKANGWQTATMRIEFENGKVISKLLKQNSYGSAFLKSLTYRPCCYNCEFVKDNTMGDITVGDFWATRVKYQDMDDNKGISMVIINTEKGKEAFEAIKADYTCTEIPYEDAFLGNHVRPVDIKTERQMIFEELDNNSVSKVLSKYAKKAKTPKKKKGLKSKIKKVVPKPVKKVLKKAVRKK